MIYSLIWDLNPCLPMFRWKTEHDVNFVHISPLLLCSSHWKWLRCVWRRPQSQCMLSPSQSVTRTKIKVAFNSCWDSAQALPHVQGDSFGIALWSLNGHILSNHCYTGRRHFIKNRKKTPFLVYVFLIDLKCVYKATIVFHGWVTLSLRLWLKANQCLICGGIAIHEKQIFY